MDITSEPFLLFQFLGVDAFHVVLLEFGLTSGDEEFPEVDNSVVLLDLLLIQVFAHFGVLDRKSGFIHSLYKRNGGIKSTVQPSLRSVLSLF